MMTSVEFKSWRERLGLSQQAAAKVLGLSKSSIELYEHGSRRDDSRPVDIPTTVELSCKYLAQQARLRQQLEKLESGKMTMRENQGTGLIDITEEWAQQIRIWLSDLDAALAAIKPIAGGFRVVRIEFGHFGEMLQRKTLDRFATKQEADAEARRAANAAPGKAGYNEEQGYWWSRDLSVGNAYRYVVEGAA
jgi:transcriptional regulator with XRE-family HTH domain